MGLKNFSTISSYYFSLNEIEIFNSKWDECVKKQLGLIAL